MFAGAFCFSINAVFASLLRTLGFRVSETVSRSYKNLGEDPLKHADGYKWGTLTHESEQSHDAHACLEL